jgi:hypothetical protein
MSSTISTKRAFGVGHAYGSTDLCRDQQGSFYMTSTSVVPTQTQAEADAKFEDFKKRAPFALRPLNIPGAYTTPAPPDDFDPNTASASELLKNGILLRRPSASDPLSIHKAWKDAFSRKWHAKDTIVPVIEPMKGKIHALRNSAIVSEDIYSSTSWSGSIIRGTWNSAFGKWTIPTISIPAEKQGTEGGWRLTSWVGIDGFNIPGVLVSNDVLQAGVDQTIQSNGSTTCYAWFTWFAPPIPGKAASPYHYHGQIANFPVSPGHSVYCAAQYVNGNAGTLYFLNETTGQRFTITLAPPANATFAGNVIEWIVETPDGGEPTTSLPKFTPITFTGAQGCGPNNVVTDPSKGDIVNIVYGKVLTNTTVGAATATINFVG